jgi:hypothetical protein
LKPRSVLFVTALHMLVAVPLVVVGLIVLTSPATAVAAGFSALLLILGVFAFAVGYAFYRALGWVRPAEVVVGAGCFISGVVLLIPDYPLLRLIGLLLLALGGVALVYPGTQSGKAYLAQRA